MPVRVDLSFMPAVLVTFEGTTTDAEFEAHLETLHASLTAKDARERVVIVDGSRAMPAPPTQRRRQADWMKANEASLRRLTLGCAFVVPSAVVRGILTAIFWIQPLPSPHAVCSTLDEALEWGDRKLHDRGLSVPLGARTAWGTGRTTAARAS